MSGADRDLREALHGEAYAYRFGSKKQLLRVERLIEHVALPNDARILDVGCGPAILARALSTRYQSYTGVDFSQAMVKEARLSIEASGLANCEILCADAVNVMKERRETYDAIFMLDISEHVPDVEWACIVQSAHGALKPGGAVYLHTPNADFMVEVLKRHGWMQQFPEHIAVRDAEENMRFFINAGFMPVDCQSLPHYNVLRHLHVLARLPILGKCLAARLWIVASKPGAAPKP